MSIFHSNRDSLHRSQERYQNVYLKRDVDKFNVKKVFLFKFNVKDYLSPEISKKWVIEQLKSIVFNGFTQIISLCGNYYSCLLKDVLMHYGLTVDTPLQRMKIGSRQRQLKICLTKGEPL